MILCGWKFLIWLYADFQHLLRQILNGLSQTRTALKRCSPSGSAAPPCRSNQWTTEECSASPGVFNHRYCAALKCIFLNGCKSLGISLEVKTWNLSMLYYIHLLIFRTRTESFNTTIMNGFYHHIKVHWIIILKHFTFVSSPCHPPARWLGWSRGWLVKYAFWLKISSRVLGVSASQRMLGPPSCATTHTSVDTEGCIN